MSGPADVTAKVPLPPPPDVLPQGIHAWLWPGAGGWGDPGAEIAAAVDQGIRGLIPQAGLDTSWCAKHADAMRAAGLFVTCGLGLDGHDSDAPACIAAIARALDCADAVMLDWESPRRFETVAGRALAQAIVDGVLTARPDAIGRVTDCPWWAPLYYVTREPGGTIVRHATHPGAPTSIFGKLCARERYVQAYGAAKLGDGTHPAEPIAAATGRSTRMLAWARDPSQYASLGRWTIRPALEMYRRTVGDHVAAMLAEPTVCLWDRHEADAQCLAGLHVVKALRARGFDGEHGVATFQRAAGLTPDGIVGPKTCAALGIPWPA